MRISLDYEEMIPVNGDRQSIRIRSADAEHPVMLFLHGGPGVCNRHLVLRHNGALADRFTLVCWDQRASGKSFRPEQLRQSLTPEQYVEDTRAVVEYLCRLFEKDKIFVVGHSWGSYLGVRLAQQYPEHVQAYIGVGQLVNGGENERLGYEFALEMARKAGNQKEIRKLGAPPVNGVYASHDAMLAQRDCVAKYGGVDYHHRGGMISSMVLPLLRTKEYRLSEIVQYAKGGMYTSDTLWNEVVACKFDETVPSLPVPVLITQGVHDYTTAYALAEAWFQKLSAPKKEWVSFAESAHSPNYEEAEKWNRVVSEFCLSCL